MTTNDLSTPERVVVCVYDNPATMQRECWQNGKLLCSYSFALFCLSIFPVHGRYFFFGANIGDWKPGQIIGDSGAVS